nr:MAG TPA: Terminase small subunit [Caudoviricetes sp.]
MAKLTDKQELFAREYLKDLNATQAAIRAGWAKAQQHAVLPRETIRADAWHR